MALHYIDKGDIFLIPGVTSYAHGCNCAGAMGKGIAVQFRKKFPDMYMRYHNMCLSGNFNPGDVYDYQYSSDGHVYNLATQKYYGTNGQYAKLQYIEKSVSKMMELAESFGVKSIALPKIGAGLGGLDWDDVKKVIGRISSVHPNVDLYVVENFALVESNKLF